MSIENRNLEVGTRLVARYKGQTYSAEVVETEEGGRFRLEDGREFKSPSSAGSAVMGGVACNGWRFWSVEGQEALPREPKAKAKGKGKATRLIQRTPNQHGVPEGQVRYFCSACMKGFLADEGEKPETCPEGHSTDGRELEEAAAS